MPFLFQFIYVVFSDVITFPFHKKKQKHSPQEFIIYWSEKYIDQYSFITLNWRKKANSKYPPTPTFSKIPRTARGYRSAPGRSSVLVRPPSEQEPICVMSWSFEDSHSSKGFSSAWEISNSYKDEFEKMVAGLFSSSLFKG